MFVEQTRAHRKYRLSLLGPFALAAPDGTPIFITSRKGMALLAMLATAPTGERTRAWLQEQLWGSRGEEQAQASLRRELANIKLALERGDAPALVQAGRDRVRVILDKIEVDVRSSGVANEGEMLPGEFLEGLDIAGEEGFEDWLRAQRRYFAEVAAKRVGAGPSMQRRGVGSGGPALIQIAVLAGAGATTPWIEQCLEDIRIALVRTSTLEVALPEVGEGGTAEALDACCDAGLDYLIQVGMRHRDEQLTLALTLSDCRSRRQIWADGISAPEHRCALLANIAATRIISAVERAEMERIRDRPVSSSDPLHLFLQADAMFRRWDRDAMVESIAIAERAIAGDPRNVWAKALAAFCHGACYASGWSDDRASSRARALELFEQAMHGGSDDAVVLGYGAGTLINVRGDMALAARLVERALELQPESGSVLFWGGWVDLIRGDPQSGFDRLDAVLKINPRSNARPFALIGLGLCLIALDRPHDAVLMLFEATQRVPTFPPGVGALAVALWSAGRFDEALAAERRLRALGGPDQLLAIFQDSAMSEAFAAKIRAIAAHAPAAGTQAAGHI